MHEHHIVPKVLGGTENNGNKVMLCVKCHGLVHNKDYGNWKLLQKEVIKRAQENGKYKGRKEKELPKNFAVLYSRYMSRETTKGKLAKLCNVSRPVLDKLLKEYEQLHSVSNSAV